MEDLLSDISKNHHQFIWTSVFNLVFLIFIGFLFYAFTDLGDPLLPVDAYTDSASLRKLVYMISPPVIGLVGLLLAIAWKPTRRGVIVLLALFYVMTMALMLLSGLAFFFWIFPLLGIGEPFALFGLGVFVAVVFLFVKNLQSLKKLDLPSVFGRA